MTDMKQPEALRLANSLRAVGRYKAAAELRRQNTEIESLQDDLAHKDDCAEQLGRELAKADSEAKKLRAKLEALEKQRPCGYLPYGYVGRSAMVFGQPVPESVPIYLAAGAQPAATRADGMPASKDERRLRRLLASRVNMPCTYWDDGEASGHEHGISIDFMRDSVESIDEKLMNLGAERLKMQLASAAGARPVEPAPVQATKPSICTDCSNADSWGLPDKPCCRSCVSGNNWQSLNTSSMNPNGPAEPVPAGEHPSGAIVNGRTHIERLEATYQFECEAGPLSNCKDWQGLKRCFEYLIGRIDADRAMRAAQPAPGAGDQVQMILKHRLMRKVAGDWLAASEFMTGEPDPSWLAKTEEFPEEWRIEQVRRVSGEQIQAGLTRAFASWKKPAPAAEPIDEYQRGRRAGITEFYDALYAIDKDRARAALHKIEPQPAPVERTGCELGCTTECKAKAHGCASECPALPWQPQPAPAAVVGPSVQADAHLAALLRYTGGFYEKAIEHGMKRGETAHAVAHVESAARALHRLAASTTQPAPAAQDDAKDAARWRYAVEIGGNQRMNWLDVYDDWDGDGSFADAIDAARAADMKEPT